MARYFLVFLIANFVLYNAEAACPSDWDEFDGFCWYFSKRLNGRDRKDSWVGAESFCSQNAGHLAIIDTREQRDWIYDQIKLLQDTDWWIGLTDHDNEGTYTWLDGTPISEDVAFWKQGEPSNTGGEDCVEMWVDPPLYRGNWNDKSCDAKDNYVCRKLPTDVITECQDGWTKNGQSCYKVFLAEQQWAEADAACKLEGGNLAAVTSSSEQSFLQTFAGVHGENFWIGLSDTSSPGTLQWSSHESFSYNNLGSGQTQSNTPYAGSTCCEMNLDLAYKWNQVKCSVERPFVCEKGFQATCPNGWMYLAKKCYEFVVNPNRATTWVFARDQCSALGAGLLKIETADQQKYLAGMMEHYYNSGAQEIWLGGSDIGHDGQYMWWDNTQITTAYWDVNMPRDHEGRDDCMALYSGKTNNNWETSSCFHERQYICELPEGSKLPSIPVIVVDGKCEDGWRWFREKCYFFGQSEMTEPEAESFCISLTTSGHNSMITSVLDGEEMSFIEGHLGADSWIGLKSTDGTNYNWVDGSAYSFQNFAGGGPSNPPKGQCVYASEESGTWRDENCNTRKRFVCKKKEIEISPIPVTPTPSGAEYEKCGGNGWISDPNSDRCYKVNIDQTRSWNDANFQCKQESGDLAAINSPLENEFLRSLLSKLPTAANVWIGGSDKLAFQDDVLDIIDQGWTWSDGSPFNYVNWNSGEPNDSGTEDCLELFIENGMWNDQNCASFRHFVCEKVGETGGVVGTDIAQSSCRSNEACCFKHLGVERGGVVPDSWLSASSVRNQNYNESRGRLNTPESIIITSVGDVRIGAHGGWEPKDDDQETSYFQVDFATHMEFKGIITSLHKYVDTGRNGYELNNERQWVKTYKVSYSQDPVNTKSQVQDWEFISDSDGKAIIFQGNTDQDTQVTNLFPRPIIARHIRCHPQTYYDRVAMRLEYIGCTASCLHKIGMGSGYITDSQITASSGDAKQARPEADPNECLADEQDKGASYRGWLSKTVSGIDCQAWEIQSPHPHSETYQNYPKAGLVANYCRNPSGKDRPWCYTTDPNVQWEYCNVPVCPSYQPTGWTSSSTSTNQWIQVQFDGLYKVAGITLYSNSQYYVTAYVVQFSDEGYTFLTYQNQAGGDHMFKGVSGSNQKYTDILREPLTTRYLRIVPKTWFNRITMQFEINGCYADRRITCKDTGAIFSDETMSINCPGGCVEDTGRGAVYGTDTYTEHSAICPAAIHAGKLINKHGGDVEYTKINGRSDYLGTFRNGITSLSYGTSQKSIIFNGRAFRCPDNWYAWNEHCYYFSPPNVEKSWTEARSDCQALGGDLASITSMAENDFLLTLIVQSFNGGKIWIGMSALDTENYYLWSDGSPVTITNWYLGEPNSRNEKCVDIYRGNGYWNDKSCETTYPYICKKEKEHLPPVTTIIPPTEDGCEPGWRAHNTSCYWTSSDTAPYYYAKQLCAENGATLASIHDFYEQAFIHAHVTSSIPPNLGYTSWIGLAQKNNEKGGQIYEWETGEPVTFTLWDEYEPDVFFKCNFPFVYQGETYYECTTVDNPIALLDYPWCSMTPVFVGPLLYCGTGYAQECTYMNDRTGYWKMDQCASLRYYTCEKPRVGYTQPVRTTPSTIGSCADGWYSTDQTVSCYQINEMTDRSQRSTWKSALDHCKAQRADLVSIHSREEEVEITKLIQQYGTATGSPFWLGLNSISQTSGYSWSDGTSVGYSNWADGEPNDHNNKEECVESTLMDYSQWNDINCDAFRNWICKIRKNLPPKDPPTLPPPQGTEAPECGGEGWIRYTTDYGVEKCYLFVDSEQHSWQYAENNCLRNGGHLVAIHSQDESTFVLSRAATTSSGTLWIGLRDIGGRSFYWADKSTVDYINWAPNEPNNYLDNEDCAEIVADTGLWNDDNCGLRKAYVCEKCVECTGQEVPPTSIPTGYCPDGFTLYENKCYYSSTIGLKYNFDTALEYCRNMSSELAVINNEYEQAFLTSFLYADKMEVSWVGMSDRGTGAFVWLDQSPITYTKWDGGQPDNWNSEEGCVELRFFNGHDGKWNDVNCALEKTFACYVPRSEDYSKPDPTHSPNDCPDGYYSWNRGCYLLVDTPKSYGDANKDCENRGKGNHLVNIVHAFENELLHSWFWRKIQNSDKLWMGLTYSINANSDSSTNTTFAWSNDWPVSYTNWGHNQPNSDHLTSGSGCVYMTSDGSWYSAAEAGDDSCASEMSYVCKISLDPIPTPAPTYGYGEGECDPTFVAIGGLCYYTNFGLTDDATRSWVEAKQECEHRDAQLASFHSDQDVQLYIESISGQSSHNLFIGLYTNGYDGWQWDDRSPVDYVNWNTYEPNGQSEQCVEMYPWSGTWNDVGCYEGRGFVCTKPKFQTKCSVPTSQRYDCGFEGITETLCVRGGRCCWDPEYVTENTTGCFYIEYHGPSGIPFTQEPVGGSGLSGGAIAGIIIGVLLAVALIAGGVYYFMSSGKSLPAMPTFSYPTFSSTKTPVPAEKAGFDNPVASPDL